MVQRLNYGVVFKKTTDLVIARDFWLHTFEIIFPENLETPILPVCKGNNQSCQVTSHVLAQINNVCTETSSRLNDTLDTMMELIPETKIHKSRSKRSLLPFIGKLSKGLFGTATMEDVNILAKHMNKLPQVSIGLSKALAQHEDHMSSFISSANDRMDNLVNGIEDNMLAIKFIQSEIYSTKSNLEQVIDYLMDILTDQIKTTSKLNFQLEKLKAGIFELVSGNLSPFLVPKKTLLSTLQDIQALLQQRYAGFHLTVKTLVDVYSHCKFLYARNGTKLYITLKLPISYIEKPFSMFKVMSVPVPINSTSNNATQILDLPEYFAVSSGNQLYTTLRNSDLQDCTGKSTTYCSSSFTLSPVTSSSCILALYANDKTQIKKLCNFRYVHDIIKPTIMELTSNTLLIYRTPLLSMECHNKHKMVTGCDFCICSLPCRCSVSSNDFYIIPRLGSCHKLADYITIMHPVNLALLQHFFDNSVVEKLLADTTFKTIVNVSVPNLKFYDMSNVIANDNKAHLNLRKMAEVAKKDGTIFKTFTEPLLDGEIKLNSDWPTTSDIINLCSVSSTVLLCILLVWTMFRVQKLMVAIAVLQKASPCKALQSTVPSFFYKTAAPSDETYPFPINLELTWEQANFIVLTVIVFILLILLYKYLKHRHRATLCLEVTAGKQCILLDVMLLPLCPFNLDIQTPDQISSLDVNDSCFFPTLFISWPNFTITNKINDTTFHVSDTITLSLFL